MSATMKMYLVRRLHYGYQYTVLATSSRAAMSAYLGKFPWDADEEFAVKERGADEWDACFRVGKGGVIRKVAAE